MSRALNASPVADNDTLTNYALIGSGVLVVTSGLFWVAANLAAVLAGDAWGSASFRHSPAFTWALITRGDVRAAWTLAYPTTAAPSAADFWFALTLLSLFVGTAVILLVLRRADGRGERQTTAEWATRRQERSLAVSSDPVERRWQIVAGRGHASRKLLAGADCVSAVAFGPNGSGKTTTLIVPNVLDWDGPVVFTTAKAQDLEPVVTARAAKGPVWVIAPGGAPGHETTGWSPIVASTDPESADRVAEWMVDSSGMTSDPKARPWNAQARKYLKGLLLATNLATGTLEQWTGWINAGERARDHVEDILRSHGNQEVAAEYSSTWQIHEEGKGSVLFTALGLADVYTRPGIRTAIEGGDFTPQRLLEENGTLCFVTPSSEGDRFAPYFTTVITAVLHEAERRASAAGEPLDPRLLLALDEAGNVFRYPRLPQLLTTARGNGIQLLLIYHDLAQIEHLYGGRQVARTVVSNAKMRLLLPGVGDLETLRYWSELMGRTRSKTHGETRAADGRRSTSINEQHDNLAPLHLLQQLPDGEALMLYQNLPPARLDLQPWYTNRRYRDHWR